MSVSQQNALENLVPSSITRGFGSVDIGANIHRILELVPAKERENITHLHNQTEVLANQLTGLVGTIRQSQIGYNFANYDEQICLSDEEILSILDTEFFHDKTGTETPL